VGIRYNVITVYPLFGAQSQKRSMFFELRKMSTKERLAFGMLRLDGLKYKSQPHKSCMMNRQITVEKNIGTVKCVATCGAIEI